MTLLIFLNKSTVYPNQHRLRYLESYVDNANDDFSRHNAGFYNILGILK